eukprot:12293533-Karenia_brevis.AAC.1
MSSTYLYIFLPYSREDVSPDSDSPRRYNNISETLARNSANGRQSEIHRFGARCNVDRERDEA